MNFNQPHPLFATSRGRHMGGAMNIIKNGIWVKRRCGVEAIVFRIEYWGQFAPRVSDDINTEQSEASKSISS